MAEGKKLHGSDSAWDVANNEDEHASDIEADTPTRHTPLGTATGDILYWDGSKWVTLADVSAGSYLRSGGVATAPLWSTLKLPNAATTGDILYATGANTIGNLADVALGQVLASGGAGAVPAYTASPSVTGTVTAKPVGTAGIQLDPNAATGNFTLDLSPANLTGNQRVTFPDATGTVTLGTGAATQIAFWSDANTITGQAGFTWDSTNYVLNFPNSNVFINDAGNNTMTGIDNFFVGDQAGHSNTTGAHLIGIGLHACMSSTTATWNIGIGSYALETATGDENVAIGAVALRRNTIGEGNVAIASDALTNNTEGDANIAIGYASLMNNVLGNNNLAIGYGAGGINVNGSYNIYLGALANATVGSTALTNSIAIGYAAYVGASHSAVIGGAVGSGLEVKVGLGTTTPTSTLDILGSSNVTHLSIRADAAQTNAHPLILLKDSAGSTLMPIHSDASSNIFIGLNTGAANTIGAWPEGLYNTFIGRIAGQGNTTGYMNVALGAQAFYTSSTGYQNTAAGYGTLAVNTIGARNTAIGTNALNATTEGVANTAIGYNTGTSITTASNCIVVGQNITTPSATTDGQMTIGNLLFGTGIDGTGTTLSSGSIGVGINAPAARLHAVQYSATDNAILEVARFEARVTSTNPGAAGFGPAHTHYGESSVDGTYRQMAQWATAWATATDATRKARSIWSVWDTAEREGIRVESDGNLARIGVGVSTTPTAKLEVILDSSALHTASSVVFYARDTATSQYGQQFTVFTAAGGDSSAQYFGVYGHVVNYYAHAFSGLFVGGLFHVYNGGGTTVTDAIAIDALIENEASSVTTTGYGARIRLNNLDGGSSFTTAYGLYIGDIAGTGAGYSIYTNAGSIVLNAGGNASSDFTVKSDAYNAIFVDASNDSIALMSNASGKVGFYGGTAVARGTALTAQLTTITHTAPGTPDYAIQDFVDVSLGAGWAFKDHDEANTVLSVIANLQTRVAELEARLGSATGVNLFA